MLPTIRVRSWPCPAGRGRRAATGALLLGSLLTPLSACGPSSAPAYLETGDLTALHERGVLRILMPGDEPMLLRRQGRPIDQERELATELAQSLGLTPQLIPIADRADLLDALLEGRGDLAVARLTVTASRRQRMMFSAPLDYVREILVVPAHDDSTLRPEDLAGKRVAARASSSYAETLKGLQNSGIAFELVEVAEDVDTEQILDRVARGEFDATAADDDLLDAVFDYRDDLRGAFPLTKPRPVAWAMRPGSFELKRAVDGFLQARALTGDLSPIAYGDLPEIRARRILRVLTRNNAVTTYLHRGEQVGFEFELARRFARSIGCRIQLVIPPSADLLIPWLLEGRGDLIAASMTVTPERSRQVTFTRPYLEVRETLVVRASDETVDGLEDLSGRTLAVRRSSSYAGTLAKLANGHSFRWIEAPEDEETEELIAAVAEGIYDATVADSHILAVELAWRDDVRAAAELGEPARIAWAVRPDDRRLREAIDRFIDAEYRGAFYNILVRRYFEDERRIAERAAARPARSGQISRFDGLFRSHGITQDLDWRLLAAVAYQESRFDPRKRSRAGALGLMQVVPRTAREVGVHGDLRDPDVNVRAGSRYLRRLANQYGRELPLTERLRFSLASYNAGRGHVLDGRRLARELGLDPDVWYGHVERAMPLLAKPEYARRARYGYCRCRETVAYVREVNERYEKYARAVD